MYQTGVYLSKPCTRLQWEHLYFGLDIDNGRLYVHDLSDVDSEITCLSLQQQDEMCKWMSEAGVPDNIYNEIIKSFTTPKHLKKV